MSAPFCRDVAPSGHGAVDPAALRAEGVDPRHPAQNDLLLEAFAALTPPARTRVT
jgi:hypothetical protein